MAVASTASPPTRFEARRRRVLEAAVQAISDVGVESLRLTDISERADMSPGHILYYFGRKERVLIETLRWSEEDLGDHRGRVLARIKDPRRRLHRFVELYLPTRRADPRWNLWAQVYAHPPEDTETLLLLETLTDLWRTDLARIVEEGVRTGRFGSPEDAGDLLRRAVALMDGLALELLVGSPRLSRAEAVRTVVRALERELRAPHP